MIVKVSDKYPDDRLMMLVATIMKSGFKLEGVTTGRMQGMKQVHKQNYGGKPMETKKFFIAGVKFHELKSCIKQLKEGDHLELVPEPTNPYDPNAVRIEFNDADRSYMTGFVPKKFSSEVSAAITVGKKLECVITSLNPQAKTWEQCEVEIKEVS